MHGETQTADHVRCSASRCTSRSYWPSRRSTFFRLVPTFLTAFFTAPSSDPSSSPRSGLAVLSAGDALAILAAAARGSLV